MCLHITVEMLLEQKALNWFVYFWFGFLQFGKKMVLLCKCSGFFARVHSFGIGASVTQIAELVMASKSNFLLILRNCHLFINIKFLIAGRNQNVFRRLQKVLSLHCFSLAYYYWNKAVKCIKSIGSYCHFHRTAQLKSST